MSAKAVLLTLPFAQLLTLDFGFPLKLYEVAILAWLTGSLFALRIQVFDVKIAALGAILFVYIIVALYVNISLLSNEGEYSYVARFTPLIDGILKSFYVLLVLLGLNLVAYSAAFNKPLVLRLWMIGALLAAGIQIVLFALSVAKIAMPPIPGMPLVPQYIDLWGMKLYRAGTFLEGNYAGPFFILSLLIAFSLRRYISMALCLLAAGTTFSTTGWIGFIVSIAYVVIAEKDINRKYLVMVISILLLLIAIPYIREVVFNKLADTREYASVEDRNSGIRDAWQQFYNNPLLGVGISQYGTHYEPRIEYDSEHVLLPPVKAIPNNVYVEIISELGLPGLGLFGALIVLILTRAMRCPDVILRAGVIAIIVFWLSSPTVTMMYYWVYFGVVCGAANFYDGDSKEAVPLGRTAC